MNREAVHQAIASTISVSFDAEAGWVETQCLYPSNATVVLRVSGGKDTFSVSDDAGAIREATSCGVQAQEARRAIARIVEQQGLIFADDQIVSPPVETGELGAAAMLVANASQEVAHWLLAHIKVRAPRNFRKDLADLLARSFGQELRHNLPIIGISTKPHKFEHVIHLPSGKRLLIDPVVNEASSINARLVANLDVKEAKIADLEQRIVYDDHEDWKSSDLSLLEMGAPIVPFSMAETVIERLKAA
jgi:hypothetical protein